MGITVEDGVTVTLNSPVNGDKVAVALQGATVYSYVMKGTERLFHSSKSPITGPAAIRGGIPICWPVFGPPPKEVNVYSKLKQHGFARTSKWTYDSSQSGETDRNVKAVFTLEPTDEIKAVFEPDFRLTYTVLLQPDRLHISLGVQNPSGQDLSFQALLHSYLHLPTDTLPPNVFVEPLTSLNYADKVQNGQTFLEKRNAVNIDGPKGEMDRVYFKAPDVLEVNYSKGNTGSVTVQKSNLSDVVLWNPGQEKGAGIGDMEEGGASKYFCIEPGQIGDWVVLEQGKTWEGSVTYKFSDSSEKM